MVRMMRVSVLTWVAACTLGAFGCSGSNDAPAPGGGVSGAPSTPAGGSPSSEAGSGQVAQAGSPNTGSGGMSSMAGAPSTGSAGKPATGGGGAPASGSFSPLCAGLMTAAGMVPSKAVPCTPADPQVCYKTCGPLSSGFKSETCTGGVYVEPSGSLCEFPPELDASCFKIPATQDASCPATAPQAGLTCTVAACTPCNAGGMYLDSMLMPKTGYCVCPMAKADGTMGKWSCATAPASWPCPQGKGCL